MRFDTPAALECDFNEFKFALYIQIREKSDLRHIFAALAAYRKLYAPALYRF